MAQTQYNAHVQFGAHIRFDGVTATSTPSAPGGAGVRRGRHRPVERNEYTGDSFDRLADEEDAMLLLLVL